MVARQFVLCSSLLASAVSFADSGVINLNLDLGVGAPLSGRYGTGAGPNYVAQALGPHLTLGVDYQLFRPLALELLGEVGLQFVPSWLGIRNLEKVPPTLPMGGVGVGPRLRFFDTEKGNLWASLHAGVRGFDGLQFAVDAGAGYQFALARRLGLGPFLRGTVLPPNATSKRGTTFLLALGVSGSFELVPFTVPPPPPPPDTDGDGLSDDVEVTQLHTDPKKADTDADGLADGVEGQHRTNPLVADTDDDALNDGAEVTAKTNPTKADSDDDGLNDGAEVTAKTNPLAPDTDLDGLNDGAEVTAKTDPRNPDTDADGLKDGIEATGLTDPLKADSDGDGISDGDEDTNKNGVVDPGETDPRVAPPPDTDSDDVPDPSDNCPAVAGPADNQGCPKENKQLVVITKEKIEILEKVYFNTRDSAILPKSFKLLDQVASVLTSHPEIKKVQIEGHTDNVGAEDKNLKLSRARAEAVFAYLSKKVDPSRLEPIGYGPTRPAGPNDTPAGREKNRRVEFKIVGD
jgi:outer membrane protein OmpA-like peptidoglycan-associated protein